MIDARKRSLLERNFYSDIAFKVMHRIHLEYSTSSTGNFQLGDITNFDLDKPDRVTISRTLGFVRQTYRLIITLI